MINFETRIKALAKYLGVDAEDIEPLYNGRERYYFEVKDDSHYVEEYIVVTEDEGYRLASEDIENLIDDGGIEVFTKYFQEWILDYAVDESWFDEWLEEEAEYYAQEQTLKDLYDAGFLNENDFYNKNDFYVGEDGEIDFEYVKSSLREEEAREEFKERYISNTGNAVYYFKDTLGGDEFSRVVIEHNLLDIEKIVDEAIHLNGVAHILATYDGEEIELENNLFAYRTE